MYIYVHISRTIFPPHHSRRAIGSMNDGLREDSQYLLKGLPVRSTHVKGIKLVGEGGSNWGFTLVRKILIIYRQFSRIYREIQSLFFYRSEVLGATKLVVHNWVTPSPIEKMQFQNGQEFIL